MKCQESDNNEIVEGDQVECPLCHNELGIPYILYCHGINNENKIKMCVPCYEGVVDKINMAMATHENVSIGCTINEP